jgi:phage terminase large subunit-like protein
MACPPLYMTNVSAADVKRGDGDLVVKFQEQFCRVTKDGFASQSGELIRFRPWQRNLAGAIYARRRDGHRNHRRALIGLPRKNGKSAIGSGFALHGLLTDGDGAEVYGLACDKDQAKIVFNVAKRMVELDPQLSSIIKCYRDVLEVPGAGSIYKALSSEAYTKEGLNPTTVIYDELHAAPNDELYDVMLDAFGARRDPLMICITTAGVKSDSTGGDSLCYRLYQYGKQLISHELEDDTFFFAWWGSPDDADPSLPQTWEASNPGYNDLLDPADFVSTFAQHSAKGTINDFKTKRMNQWVSQVKAWMPDGAWSLCERQFEFTPPPKGVVLGFDGSNVGDSTALVAVTVEPDPKLIVLGAWEKPIGQDIEWRVPREDVKEAIRQACRTYNVREVAADEFIWVGELEELLDEGIPVVSFPQTMTRMGPATQRFYELVVTSKRLSHDGNLQLARHIGNAQLKSDPRGARLVKDARGSPRKIDLAVAAVMAVDRAGYWLSEDAPGTFNGMPVKDIHFVW